MNSDNNQQLTSESDGASSAPKPGFHYSVRRIRAGLLITLLGFLVFLLGTRPSSFGLDRSPVIGFVQIAVFLVGLGTICCGGYLCIMTLWGGKTPSIAADIGLRLIGTGYIIAWFAGMADVFGFGSHLLPNVPYFGSLQARGVQFGEFIIAIGFLLLIPYPQPGDGGADKKK